MDVIDFEIDVSRDSPPIKDWVGAVEYFAEQPVMLAGFAFMIVLFFVII